EHHTIDATPEDFRDIQGLVRTLEEPLVDPSAVPLGKLSQLASQSLKVVLSGEGGDELFGGYHRYFWDRFMLRYTELPKAIRRTLETLITILGNQNIKRRVQKLSR